MQNEINELRQRILKSIEHDGRVDLGDLAVRLGVDETDV